MDRKNGTIRVKLETSSIKAAFDILEAINPVNSMATLTFTVDGFSVCCVSQPPSKTKKKSLAGSTHQRCQVNYTFESDNLSRYIFNLKGDNGNILPNYDVDISIPDFIARIKSLKKDTLNFKICVNANGTNSGLLIKVPGSGGQKYLQTTKSKKKKYIDQYDKWYKGTEPKAKPFLHAFSSTVTSARHSKCSDIEFHLNTRTQRMSICCWGTSDIPLHAEPFDNVDSNSSCEEGGEQDTIIKRTINMDQNNWIMKIPKLSQSAVLKIYLSNDEGAPLLLRTFIGMQGTATFSISNI